MVCLLSGYELPWAAWSRELLSLMAPGPLTQRCLLLHCLLWKPQRWHRLCSQADQVWFWHLRYWLTLDMWLHLCASISSDGAHKIDIAGLL